MKSFFFILFVGLLIVACNSENENPKKMNLSIRLIGTPKCNDLKSGDFGSSKNISQTCVEYAYDNDNRKLILKHLNAGFNCCPESLWCSVNYRNDSIIIQEFEKHLGCKCNCLYNLDIEISGVEMGRYWLKISEPYVDNQQLLEFEIDLWSKKQGQFCVARTNYPWNLMN